MAVTEFKLVEYTGRLVRHGKATISAELAGIFERLGFSAQSWQDEMDKLRGERLLGRIFAASCIKLREIAKRAAPGQPEGLSVAENDLDRRSGRTAEA